MPNSKFIMKAMPLKLKYLFIICSNESSSHLAYTFRHNADGHALSIKPGSL